MFHFRTISQILQMYILPEVVKRITDGTLQESDLPLEVHQFRAIDRKLPDGGVSRVTQLNQEVNIIAKVKFKEREISPNDVGKPVYLDDIDPEKCFIQPPIYDGKPAAYFLGQSLFIDYSLFLDLRPNAPDFEGGEPEESNMPYPIADFINSKRFKDVVQPLQKLNILANNNWPPAPGYYPNVLLELHKNQTMLNTPEFIETVSSAYGNNYWDMRFDFWKDANFFPKRLPYLERALDAHFNRDYIASIYILVPQFEGIIRDFLIECGKCGETQELHFLEYVERLNKLIVSRNVLMFPREVIETIFDYLKIGSFWGKSGTIDDPSNTINRHGIAHGIFTGFECEEISLKYLILLDALSFVLLHDKMLTQSL